MKIETINGKIIIEYISADNSKAMISAGNTVASSIVYDNDPDAGWGNYSQYNMEKSEVIVKEIPDAIIFRAIIGYYKPLEAYTKLIEIGMINKTS